VRKGAFPAGGALFFVDLRGGADPGASGPGVVPVADCGRVALSRGFGRGVEAVSSPLQRLTGDG